MQPMKKRAEDLHRRAQELRAAGAVAQMTKGPQLVEETGAFMVELAARLDAITPFLDEGAAS
ncbi:hypothetical protein MHM88_01675 [Epibacterium sp. MM17-32]|uniref:hypothetical protein n=1 Tax=Epibacterium sp. MM17-32 TaxID=2917734 RepID=UPI001EF51600|nr:hypothetical protein [Epibacterium sp. MM17-32]MCG7626499.1 hypothetical protein [Epibacterium sp. MM17-32]